MDFFFVVEPAEALPRLQILELGAHRHDRVTAAFAQRLTALADDDVGAVAGIALLNGN
ncbi:hypothetical protein [Pandoraea oxalativorans]|uniref:hypothetical protein n=1 Tax=Pandoraea oxalativorans TaxID=573737 RepID=UPI0012F4AED4|nr:hypothetical protein [Pandoraea oxalativorans]